MYIVYSTDIWCDDYGDYHTSRINSGEYHDEGAAESRAYELQCMGYSTEIVKAS